MHKSTLGFLHSHRFIQYAGHGMQIHQRNILFLRQPAYCIRKIEVGIFNLSVLIETATLSRRYQYRLYPTGTCLVYKCLQACHERIERTFTGSFLFLVVMTELHKDIVARLHLRQGFLQAAGTNKGIGGLAGFGIIGKANAIGEETRHHLAPAGPRFIVLVYNCRVATQENCRNIFHTVNNQFCHLRSIPVKLQGQFVIPVQLTAFTGFDTYVFFLRNMLVTLINRKSARKQFSLPGLYILKEKTARFSSHRGFSHTPLTADNSRNTIVSIGHGNRKEERRLTLTVRRSDQVISISFLFIITVGGRHFDITLFRFLARSKVELIVLRSCTYSKR